MKKKQSDKQNKFSSEFAKKSLFKEAEKEERKFSSINPVVHNDFNSRYIFWSSLGEIIGRSMVIIARVGSFIFSIVFISLLVSELDNSKKKDALSKIIINSSEYIIACLVVIQILISFLYIIPIVLIKRVSALYSWGIMFIIFAILNFLLWETIIVFFIIYEGIQKVSGNSLAPISTFYIVSMVVVFLFTMIGIVSGCILISKSDDVKRELTIE